MIQRGLLTTFIILILSIFQVASSAGGSKTLFTEATFDHKSNWREIGSTDRESIKHLLKLILRSKVGKKIVRSAQKKTRKYGKTVIDIVEAGEGSICDTTLVRRFSPRTPDKIVYETRTKVLLNKNLPVIDAVLDLVHELTHYTYRTAFNPYSVNFTLKEFVKATVEGKGGEVDAYLVECKVLREIFPKEFETRSNCVYITDLETGKLSRKKAVMEFYKVGRHIRAFKGKIEKYGVEARDIPYLNGGDAKFISSAYSLPYPVAAFEEYVTIMSKACENDWNRLVVMKHSIGRIPASENKAKKDKSYNRMKRSYRLRCSEFYSKK